MNLHKPISRKLTHVIGWTIMSLYHLTEDIFQTDYDYSIDLLFSITYVSVHLVVFYMLYRFVWGSRWGLPRLLVIALGLLLGVVVFIAFRYFLEQVFCGVVFDRTNYNNPSFWNYVSDNTWRGLYVSLISLLVYFFEKNFDSERARVEAELAFLRSQLNPHFLFNTLSMLHTEILAANPALASRLLQFSDVLRHTLMASKSNGIALSEELAFIENYISLFQQRFDQQKFVKLDIVGDIQGYQIEPLLLIPFVENGLKHGDLTSAEEPLLIRVKIENDTMNFSTENRVGNISKDPGHGVGLSNIRKRLDLIYKNRYELQVFSKNNKHFVNLMLKLS